MSKPRLLVVEDDLRVVRSLIQGLDRHGFDVSIAMDGEEGLARALAEPFELIVLDLMLPKRSGFEVLEALQGRISTPVIVLSARTELPARLRSFQDGAVDFVPKPFFMEELVARIRSRLAIVETAPHRELAFADVVVYEAGYFDQKKTEVVTIPKEGCSTTGGGSKALGMLGLVAAFGLLFRRKEER